MRRTTLLSLFSLLLLLQSQAIPQDKSAAEQIKTPFDLPESDEGLPGAGPVRRYDWFQRLWSERRSKWAEQVQQDQEAIVFLGDSITQGWGAKLNEAFAPAKVANRGISGDTTRGMLMRVKQDVLSLNPTAVVLLMGTNDLEEKAEPEIIAGNLKLIVAELKKHSAKMPIVLCQTFPSSETKQRPVDKIKKLNALYAEAVAGDSQITVLDTWALFADAEGNAKLEEFPDLLHPNEAGYDKWSKALRPILATLGDVDIDEEEFVPEAGFVSLFNGHDLTGWCVLPTTPEQIKQWEKWKSADKSAPPWPIIKERTELTGKSSSPDGRYVAKNGRLIVTTPAEGRRIQQLWTTTEFPKDFTLKLEFRATPNADSGVFLRQPQLQCRDYLLAGPYKQLKKFREGDWNELVVVAKGGLAYCTCNGEVLEGAFKLPETGPIGLEGDRGQLEYRRIRIRHGDNLLSPTANKDSWRFETAEGGEGKMEVVDDTIVFETTKSTGTNWHVHAFQGKLELESGAKYSLRFKLKSPNLCNVTVMAMLNQEDWHEIGLNEAIDSNREFTDYEFAFVAHDVSPDNNRISFELGAGPGKVILKDLVLQKLDTAR